MISRAPPPQDIDSHKYMAKINIAVARLQQLKDEADSLTAHGYKEYEGMTSSVFLRSLIHM